MIAVVAAFQINAFYDIGFPLEIYWLNRIS